MTTIIAGTNREDSMTMRVAGVYYNVLSGLSDDVHILSLQNKEVWKRGEPMLELEQKLLIPASRFIFVMPEYNASFPGVLKMMMDNSDIKKCWWHKKAALAGISDGRAGNIRGVEHMTAILNYLKINVLYNKMFLSRIKEEMGTDGNLLKPETEKLIQLQMEEFMKF